jgi:hypothetical protein
MSDHIFRENDLGRCCLAWLALTCSLHAANAPTGLLCDLLEHPELTVITTSTPQFGWIYNPSFRNDSQTGYRVIVSSSQTLASQGQGNLWDSGLAGSAASINVPYAGAALQTKTVYYWCVQTEDGSGQISPFSAVQQFRTDTQFYSGANLLYNVSTNTWANRYPLAFQSVGPALITNTAPGRWFVDFGQDAFGYATVQLNGSFNGNPDAQTVNPPASYGTVMPFRYFELTNCPVSAVLTAADAAQQRLLDQFNTNAAAFSSSSAASSTLSNNWLIVTNVGSGQHALWLNTNNTPSPATLYSNWAAAWFGANAANPAIAGWKSQRALVGGSMEPLGVVALRSAVAGAKRLPKPLFAKDAHSSNSPSAQIRSCPTPVWR